MMKRLAAFLALTFILQSLLAADYIKNTSLSLDASDITHLDIDCGAGALWITGAENIETITVEAEIIIDRFRGQKAEEYISDYLDLELERDDQDAYLYSHFESRKSLFRSIFNQVEARVNLTVVVPSNLRISLRDGSGDIKIENIKNNLIVVDGSGDILIKQIKGDLDIDDGSGKIDILSIVGQVEIDDGSGALYVGDIDGSVFIDDGSGDINIERVKKDVEIINHGTGQVDISQVDGEVIR